MYIGHLGKISNLLMRPHKIDDFFGKLEVSKHDTKVDDTRLTKILEF